MIFIKKKTQITSHQNTRVSHPNLNSTFNTNTHLIFSTTYPATTSIPYWLQIRRETTGTLVTPAHACCLDRLPDSKESQRYICRCAGME